jgi:ATP-binding cassette subfamily G (WHITE) protein 2 (SNQ2)
LFFTEINTKSESDHPVTLFKRGTKPPAAVAPQAGADDEESGSRGKTRDNGAELEEDREGKRKALESQQAVTDIFSWQGVTYTVPLSGGETRRLLDNVSGYVAPGKLTALMGESGAGKVGILRFM